MDFETDVTNGAADEGVLKTPLTEALSVVRILRPFADRLDDAQHRADNAAMLDAVAADPPPLEQFDRWGQVSYLAALYARMFARTHDERPLSSADGDDLLRAVIWGIDYERNFPQGRAAQQFRDFVILTEHGLGTPGALAELAPRLLSLLSVGATAHVKRLLEALAGRAEQAPDELVHALQSRMDAESDRPALVATRSLQRQSLDELIQRLDSGTDLHRVGEKLVSLWHLLDPARREDNERTLQRVVEEPASRMSELARLCHVAASQVHRRGVDGRELADAELEASIELGNFAADHATGPRAHMEDEAIALSLSALRDLRLGAADPALILSNAERAAGFRNQRADFRAVLDPIVETAVAFFAHHRAQGATDSSQLHEWAKALARHVDDPSERVVGDFLAEASAHGLDEGFALHALRSRLQQEDTEDKDSGPLGFLREDERERFRRDMRDGEMADLSELLERNRPRVITAVLNALADEQFLKIQEPQGFVFIRDRRGKNDFNRLCRLAKSTTSGERREAMNSFNDAVVTLSKQSDQAVAREWAAYAKAQERGFAPAVQNWAELHSDRQASPEVLWNLAGAYTRMSSPHKALEVLGPEVSQRRARFSHLGFALRSAVAVLELAMTNPSALPAGAEASAKAFLRECVRLMPLAECYVLWLALVPRDLDIQELLTAVGHLDELIADPIRIPSPRRKGHDEAELEDFRNRLHALQLHDTWRMWMTECSERGNQYWPKVWDWLIEACEQTGDIDAAQDAAARSVELNIIRYNGSKRDVARRDSAVRVLRISLVRLYRLLRKHDRQQKFGLEYFERFVGRVEANNRLRLKVPELLDENVRQNAELLRLVRDFLPRAPEPAPGQGGRPEPPSGTSDTEAWNVLHGELARVDTVAGLSSLQSRIKAAIDLRLAKNPAQAPNVGQIVALVDEVCDLGSGRQAAEHLAGHLESLNTGLERAAVLASGEPPLAPLVAVVAAAKRAFTDISGQLELRPAIGIERYDGWRGIAREADETSVVIAIDNPGPGPIDDVEVWCSTSEGLQGRGSAMVAAVGAGATAVVAVPVTRVGDHEELACELGFRYRWGVVEGLSHTAIVDVPTFDFPAFLAEHDVHGHELSSPFVYDRGLRENEIPELFEGRAAELDKVRSTLAVNRPPPNPLYFYGTRRVGKSTLLTKIKLELQAAGLAVVYFDCFGIDAANPQVTPATVARILLDNLHTAAVQQLDVAVPPPNTADFEDALEAVQPYVRGLADCVDPRQLVILVDEFQRIVDDSTTPLLDLFRRLHEHGFAYFAIGGNKPALPMLQGTRSQLTLSSSNIGLFSPAEIERQVRGPLGRIGVDVPESTLAALLDYAAGHPNFTAKLAARTIPILNHERRNVVTPQDIRVAADDVVKDRDLANSWLSSQSFSLEERNAAIKFAHALPDGARGMPLEEALRVIDADIAESLAEKHVLELRNERLAIKGQLLADYLKERITAERVEPKIPTSSRRIGVFIDLENTYEHLPSEFDGLTPREFGMALRRYYGSLGEIKCAWGATKEKRRSHDNELRLALQTVQIETRFVPREQGDKPNQVLAIASTETTPSVSRSPTVWSPSDAAHRDRRTQMSPKQSPAPRPPRHERNRQRHWRARSG